MTNVGGIHHIGLTVSNLDRSIPFYCRYFDLTEIGRFPLTGTAISDAVAVPNAEMTLAMLMASDGKAILELTQYDMPPGERYRLSNNDIGAAHVCFSVEDLAALVARMEGDGVALNAPVQQMGGTSMVFVRDPDGINIEIIEPGPGMSVVELAATAAK